MWLWKRGRVKMVEWLAGNRIRGTTAERPSASLQSPSVGGWKELARTTLGSAGDDITVSSLPDKRYYQVLWNSIHTGNCRADIQLGSSSVDTSSNYAYRYSTDGAVDPTPSTGASSIVASNGGTSTLKQFGNVFISNLSAKEKLVLGQTVTQSTAGAATAPNRREWAGKWANTSNPLDIVNLHNNNSGDWSANSEVVVLGWDPDDTHTTNFWEELASANGTGSSTEISSGTISAKKYLWLQMWNDTGATSYTNMTFNNDTASNYARRTSEDGAADSTAVSEAAALLPPNVTGPHFMNIFIINNSANEKLCIFHNVGGSSAGAATVPLRSEGVFKWANTSAQITEIDMTSSSGNYTSNSILKVWGAN